MNHSSSYMSLLEGQLSSSSSVESNLTAKMTPVSDVWTSLHFDDLLDDKGKALRIKTKELMTSLEKEIIPYINKCEFPFPIVDKIRGLGANGLYIKDFGGPGLNNLVSGAIVYEMAKIDASIATFFLVHNSIGMAVVDMLGSEEQRSRILPDCIALKKVMSFGLTEAEYGSDASGLKTTAKKVQGGYVINGNKRWIGNATFADYIIIWAKNEDDGNKVQAFIVEKGSKGLSTAKIENKYALRMVQNADIFLEDVFVPDHNKLEKATDFATGANKVLEHSRVKVAWVCVGIAAGAYEAALKYALERKQFGKPIAAYQITQVKLSKMLSMIEGMATATMRVCQLYEEGKTTIGQIGRTKSNNSQMAREVCQMAREICGGNGIILDFRVMKCLMDIEAVHTYEGTYEVNMLVSGREITGGLNAFKK